MTTLPTLIQQLRAARPDSLTELREAIAEVAEAVVANDCETGDDCRCTACGLAHELNENREAMFRRGVELAGVRGDRDRLAAEVKTIAETTEAALTKRIAAWLYDESSNLASMANTREANDRNQRSSALANVADSLRAGTWKETK